jgi:hypothetical protein
MRGKTDANIKPVTLVPGPGNYSPSTKLVEPSLAPAYSFGGKTNEAEEQKLRPSKAPVPGPGNYAIPSTLKSKTGAVFGTEKRSSVESKTQRIVPGPGAYSTIVVKESGKAFGYRL